MLEIQGKVNTAICYAAIIEDEAIEVLKPIYNFKALESGPFGRNRR